MIMLLVHIKCPSGQHLRTASTEQVHSSPNEMFVSYETLVDHLKNNSKEGHSGLCSRNRSCLTISGRQESPGNALLLMVALLHLMSVWIWI